MALPAAMVLSGLNEEHFSDGLCDIFNHGSVLLKSPSSSSIASSSETIDSQESGISSMSSETSVVKNLGLYLDLLYEAKVELKAVDNVVEKSVPSVPEDSRKNEILYENRDILDLGGNTKWCGWNFQPARIRNGIQYFFENRSQYSRLLGGAQIPEHIVFYCPYRDCLFGDLIYSQ